MKRVLILTIGCQLSPWDKMIQTSLDTWDSFEIKGVENIFFCGEPVKENTDKIIYFPVEESYFTMSKKMLMAFEWALKNKEFDYIARINSSTYVDKTALAEYIKDLPYNNLFEGIEVEANPKWMVGWSYIISRDVIQKLVDNSQLFRHDITDDLAISYVANELNIPYSKGKICSIDKRDMGWACISYGGQSFEFSDFKDCNKSGQHFYRVKFDGNRDMDAYLMEQLFKNLY